MGLCWFLQDPEQLQENANQILTAIIQGMRKEEPSNNVKLAATNALLNSLEFTKANFDKEVPGPSGSEAKPSFCAEKRFLSFSHDLFLFADRETFHHAGGL